MLVAALGLVLAAMRQLDRPETVERLDQLFSVDPQAETDPPGEQPLAEVEALSEALGQVEVVESIERSEETPKNLIRDGVDLSAVRDNTYFLPEERSAWFALLGQLQQIDQPELAEKSVGKLTYAQLLQQPEVYRGRVVSLHGTVVREEPQRPGENPLGFDEYHRLWIQPEGGGQWPFVVYCLGLPSDFPRGDEIRAQVEVEGYFFKNWSYAWGDGLGLAPVVLVDQLLWQPPTASISRQQSSGINWVFACAVATVCAVGITWFALRRTRRRKETSASDDSLRQQFAKLAEEEP
jgi:hypothetical protein